MPWRVRGGSMASPTVCSMTKSPLALAKVAYAVAQKSLPTYSSKYSRHDFTQPQLFALLTLRAFLGVDLRGLIAYLADWSDLRRALELKKLPHYSTLSYAEERLRSEERRVGKEGRSRWSWD